MGLSVMVVEDDAFTRTMLVSALKQAGASVVFETASAAEAAEKAKTLKPNVGILDLHLGQGPTGVDVAHSLRRNDPSVGIVFLTSFSDPRLLNANLPPMPSRAQYLTKESVTQIEVLLRAIQDSVKPGAAVSHTEATSFIGSLSNGQIETLRLLAEGLTNAEIAKRKFITEKSVEVSVARIAKALGLAADASRNQRVHMARVFFRAAGTATAIDE